VNTRADARRVDLQVHSTASDGAVAAREIPAVAAAVGLSAFALTDHDSVNGIPEAAASAHALGIRLVPGVELSAAHHDGREVHLLGLHIDIDGPIASRLEAFRAQRAERAEMIVRKLRTIGVPITFEDVAQQAGVGAFGRPHVARAMVAIGSAVDFFDAFDRYLGAGKPAYVAKPRLSARDAIALTHDAGGIAIWAHPGADGRRDMVESLVADGLDGLEVRHPGNTGDDVARLAALCAHFSLVPSGGSDWHGEMGGRRALGCMQVPEEWLDRQDERVAARRAAGVT
jgi:predicted metal-dependent phosphoesterase TrpH